MKQIFLIDDDPVFVFLAEKMIKTVDAAVEIRTFSDGEFARDALDKRPFPAELLPDVILLDLNMPVMDGWQFLEFYSSIYLTLGKRIPVYIVSSTISPDDVERSKQYGFVLDLLIKPINADQLRKVLRVGTGF